MLRFMGLQRVRHDSATELNQIFIRIGYWLKDRKSFQGFVQESVWFFRNAVEDSTFEIPKILKF